MNCNTNHLYPGLVSRQEFLLNLFFLIDLLRLTRTSSGEIREKTQCKINKVMMGKVMSNNIKILFE